MTLVSVRYIVDDVDAAIAFYTRLLGFALGKHTPGRYAEVERDYLRLLLGGPSSSAAQRLSDGRKPQPGGWCRVVLVVDDLAVEIARLRAAGVLFRGGIVTGPGGSQVVVDDPSGNPVELFQFAR